MPQYQGVWNLAQQAQALTSQRWVTDPLYNYTTLLLQADGIVNGSQNNTFIDSSNNYFPITRNGNTTQGTFSPFSATGWSTYLLGGNGESSSSSIQVVNYPASADFDFTGSNVATIECWFYYTTLGVRQTIISFRGTGNPSFQSLAVSSGGYLAINWDIVSVPTNGGSISTTYVTPNQWHHLAYVRNASANKFYLDGIDVTSTFANPSGSGFWPYDTSPSLYIGADWYNAFGNAYFAGFLGYISNLRVTRSAVYTANFTPSPFPLTTTSQGVTAGNVKLLTFQSNRFVDNSSSAKTATLVNSPSIQAFSPFAPQFQYTPTVTGGSGYFDGSGDYVSSPSTTGAPFDFGTGNFTIEGWFYATGTGSTATNGRNLWGISQGGGAAQKISCYTDPNATLIVDVNGSAVISTAAGYTNNNFPGRWVHIAVVRSGTGTNQTVLYVNGVSAGTATVAANFTAFTNPFNIGYVGEAYLNTWLGYISNFRVVKGVAVYTGAFTPPIAPLSTSGAASASAYSSTTNVNTSFAASNTSLLLNFTNAGIYDATLKNNLETVGNAQVSTSVVKYGSGSMSFDGTGDYLYGINQVNLQFLAGDYTIEFWVNPNSFTGSPVIIDMRTANAASGGAIQIYFNTGGTLLVYGGNTTATLLITAGSVLSTGVWAHVALTRTGTSTRLFINGIQSGSTATDSTSYGLGALWIGAIASGSTNNFNGYIDDLRITKGIARYTRNFTPPQVALPRQ